MHSDTAVLPLVPRDVVPDMEAHVRAHLSAVADADDDPTTHAGEVRIRLEDSGPGVRVTGELDAEANADDLRPGHDQERP